MSDLVSEDHILARIASHFPNEGPDVLLGRGDDCDIKLVNDRVSRHHCEILYKDGHYELHDLGSTNGTYVDGVRVTRTVLRNGAVINVPAQVFAFTGGMLHYHAHQSGISIQLVNVYKTVKNANTGKPLETIKVDTERDNFMTAEEAQAYGLVDKVIYKRQ